MASEPKKPKEAKETKELNLNLAVKNKNQIMRLLRFAFTPHVFITLIGALVGIAAVSLTLYLGILVPNSLQTNSLSTKLHTEKAAQLIDYSFKNLQQRLTHLASRPNAVTALSSKDTAAIDSITNQVAQSFPEAITALAVPVGYVDTPELGQAFGFAPVDLIRRSEQNKASQPEASKKNDIWMVYFVAPVNDAAGVRAGTLLIGVPTSGLTKIWADLDNSVGKYSLSQGELSVISQGEGSGSGETVKLANADLSVKFQPSGEGESASFGFSLFIMAIIGALLFNIFTVFISEISLQKQMREDAAHLLKFIHAILNDKSPTSPVIKNNLLSNLAQSVAHYSSLVEKNKKAAALAAAAAKIKEAKLAPKEDEETDSEEDAAEPEAEVDTDTAAEDVASPENNAPSEPQQDYEEEPLDVNVMAELDDLFGNTPAPKEPSAELSDESGETETLDLDSFADLDAQPTAKIAHEIFRAYDIRGIVGETLTDETVELIGLAIGTEAITKGERTVLVGYDGRLSSAQINSVLCKAIANTGCQVTSIGQVSTPVLYFATATTGTRSGVMITGSHNPSNYNGFKIVLAGNTLSGDDIQALYDRIQTNKFSSGEGLGYIVDAPDMVERYVKYIIKNISLPRSLKVVVDCGNGAAGLTAPATLQGINCEVIPLFCEVDGNFPNHHPDPSKPQNLAALIEKVESENADIGIAFDGDGDRLGVVTNAGEIIHPDRILAILARSVLANNPGGSIIFDVKCSRILPQVIREAGGIPIMWKTGHSFIKAKLKETEALLAGEMSGHIFFNERWLGFDDGLYSAARLLEILAAGQISAQQLFDDLPATVSTPEININVTEYKKFAVIESLIEREIFEDGGEAKITTIDGVRVDYSDGWGLVRASNTTPCLVLRFEAKTEEELERIKTLFKEKLSMVDSSLDLPF